MESPVHQGPLIQNLKVPIANMLKFKERSVEGAVTKNATPLMNMIVPQLLNLRRMLYHLIFHLKSLRQWTLKNLLFRYRCMRNTLKNIRDRRIVSNSKTLPRKLVSI